MSRNSEPLNCESFEDRIHQILDDRLTLTGDSLLMDHAAHCQPCENKLHEYDAVEDSIKILKDDMDKILSGIDAKNRKRSITQRPLALLTTMAAALLVCVSAFHWLAPEPDNSNHRGFAKRVPTKQLSPAPRLMGSSLAAIEMKQKPTKPVYRPTPDTSPFSPNFSVAQAIPRIPTVSNWTDVTNRIEPVLNYSSEFLGVRATQCSIKVTIELFRKSLEKPEPNTRPDLGWVLESDSTSLA